MLPLNHVDVGRKIREFVTALHSRVRDHLDLSGVLQDADAFVRTAEELEAVKGQVPSGPSSRKLNELLMRVSRLLTPVIYSQGGRFHHDPAEWSPIMRATGQYTLAALGKAAGLPQLVNQPDYGFLRAQVIREANRLRTVLRDATRLIGETLPAVVSSRQHEDRPSPDGRTILRSTMRTY